MNNFFQFLVRLLAVGGLSMIFVIAFVLLQPSRVHRRRKISTPLLKISYLIYLAIFLIFIYFLMFTEKDLQGYFNEVNYFLTAMAGLLPTIGMLLRRKIHRGRPYYNYFLSALNFVIVVFIIWVFNRVIIVG